VKITAFWDVLPCDLQGVLVPAADMTLFLHKLSMAANNPWPAVLLQFYLQTVVEESQSDNPLLQSMSLCF
jgi:hypothetical protein